MKKRAMKKWIPEGDYCYKIEGFETQPNGMKLMKCNYCRNFYLGSYVNDEMSDNLGGYIPVKYRKRMCRYLNTELIYDDTKECGEKLGEWWGQ